MSNNGYIRRRKKTENINTDMMKIYGKNLVYFLYACEFPIQIVKFSYFFPLFENKT
jgi:hypothetical protein